LKQTGPAKEGHRDTEAQREESRLAWVLCVSVPLWLLFATAGCRQDMHDQPRVKPLARSAFFDDGRSARPLVEGTVARGQLRDDERLYTGKSGEDFSAAFPFAVDRALLDRGQQRYLIFCAPCHGQVGRGDGSVVRRGFRSKPASFHEARLREKPAGYFVDVISNGFGAMQDYAAQIPARDRWAIVAYVRALQLSQNAALEDVPPERRGELADRRRE
jgi:cytochrome c553